MLDIQFAGTDLYHLLNWFFIYSFIGWVWESAYVSVKERRLVNRGFVTGPVCTIYGCGALAIYIFLKPVSGNIVLLFAGGVIVPTILEYFTAVLMEHLFHTSWWDYSENRFNFQGRICLSSSLGWGVCAVLLFYVIHPVVEKIVALYPVAVGKVLVSAATILYAVDFGISYMNALQIGEKLRNLDELAEDIYDYVQSSKLYGGVEDLMEKMAAYRLSDYTDEIKRRLENRKDAMIAFSGHGQFEKKLAAFQAGYDDMRRKGSFFTRRAVNAYPNMKSRAQALKERAARKNKRGKEE